MPLSEVDKKPVALIDLDGSIYQGYHGLILEDLVEDQMNKRLIQMARVPELVSHIINYLHDQKGQPSTTEDLNYCWADACENVAYADLLDHARGFVKEHRERFYPFTQDVFDLLRERGIDTWLITGEPDFVAEAVRDEFCGAGYFGTIWKTKREGIPGEEKKRKVINGGVKILVNSVVKGKCAEVLFHPDYYNYSRTGSFALVDSVNDIGLVEAAPFSIVCGQPDKAFTDYLQQCGKPYETVSPRNPKQMISLIDRLTKGAL